MKKFLAAVVTIIITTTAFATVLASNYVGNSNSRKFHYADCTMVNKMNPANKVYMNTREEAFAAGYSTCINCRP